MKTDYQRYRGEDMIGDDGFGTTEHAMRELQAENATLLARVARLEEVLRFVLDECDWEETSHETGGDNRIGQAIRRALGEK